MSLFFGVPVDLAYHLVCWIAAILAPLTGGLATAAAIIAFTVLARLLLLPLSYFAVRGSVRGEGARARLQPRIAELQRRHRNDPQRLQRELGALYRAEGSGMFGGFLPLLIQLPFFSVMYRLFLDHSVGGAPNTLLTHTLLAAPLGSHWLAGAGPLSAQGAVFAGVFALLAAVAVLAVRAARRAAPAVPPVPVTPARGKVPAGTAPRASATPASAVRAPATHVPATHVPATHAPAKHASVPGGRAISFVTWIIPFASLITAAIVPLAAGLYLLTTTAWTLAERTVLRRRFISATGPQSAGAPPR
jgi:YidC/Oxa1 family membrane protein insertase